MNKKGFTLIELLAVIVILAIIALIATPIVLNIIEDSKKSAFVQTGNGIVDAAEYYYLNEMLDRKTLEDTVINFPDAGELEFAGEIPKKGSVIINTDGEIAIAISNDKYCITKGYTDSNVAITENIENCEVPKSKIMTSENSCIQSGNTCSVASIKEGILVNVKVNNEQTENFYVLADDGNKLTLILNRNLGDNIAWYEYKADNRSGPTTALEYLQLQTGTWTNLSEIVVAEFEDSNNSKKTLEPSFTMYARLPKYSEIFAINNSRNLKTTPWLHVNLNGTGDNTTDSNGKNRYGYWTSSAYSSSTEYAHFVHSDGITDPYSETVSSNYNVGVRPVIELSK